MQKTCAGYNEIPKHEVEFDAYNFPGWALKPGRADKGLIRCKICDKYRRTKEQPLRDPITRQYFWVAYPTKPADPAEPLEKLVPEPEPVEEEEEYFPTTDEIEELKPEPEPEPEPVSPEMAFKDLRFDQPQHQALMTVVPDEKKTTTTRRRSARSKAQAEEEEEEPKPDEKAEEPATGERHRYVADKDLLALWHAITTNTLKNGRDPANMIFFGPSGSGKTTGAKHLADLVGLPFTKVDAASMTDPESWFGTREIVVENGLAVTKYIPSNFVIGVQQPGVVFIDEVTRVDDEHRNVLLPLCDGTGIVTNPLTGEYLQRHPHCFIIMAGNRGLEFTGTSAVDPAFTSRAYVVNFDYISEADEKSIVMEDTGCDEPTAQVFTRFAADTREKAKNEPEFIPISTREVIKAAEAVHGGLDRDLAAAFAVMNAISAEGGDESRRQELQDIWNGVRVTQDELNETDDSGQVTDDGWRCPKHGKVHIVPKGVSKRTGKAYNAFRACPEPFCEETEGRSSTSTGQIKCGACGLDQPAGRRTFCTACGAALP